MNKLYLLLAIGTAACASAQAQTYDWTYTSTSYNGSGTFVASGNPETYTTQYGTYFGDPITSFTGTLNGIPITSLVAQNSFDGNDNLIIAKTGVHIDWSGISFILQGGEHINLYNPTEVAGNDKLVTGVDTSLSSSGVFDTSYEPGTVPEPSTMALTAIGAISGLVMYRRRK